MAESLLRVRWYEALQFSLGSLMFQMSLSRSAGLEIGAWRDRTSVEFDKNATVRKAINSAIFPLRALRGRFDPRPFR